MDEKTKRVIDKVIEMLKKEYNPEKVILFGSYAYGKPTEDSDLDFLVLVKKSLNLSSRHKLLSDFDIPVQLIFITVEEFLETKDVIGGIAYPSSKYGKVVYENT